jgi:Cd2+/Zn2+-exporting ATPase
MMDRHADPGSGVPSSQSDRSAAERAADEVAARRFVVFRTAVGVLSLAAVWLLEEAVGVDRRIALAGYLIAYVALGWEAAAAAWKHICAREINVDQLMLLAAVGAAFLGQWREGAILLFLFALSETLQVYIIGRNRRSIESLLELQPDTVTIRGEDGGERRLPAGELRVGQMMLVRPGERIGADGVIRAGRTSVDQSPVTGESMPVEKGLGDQIFAASLNQTGAIEVEVTRAVEDSFLARIIRMVERVQREKASSQRMSDWFGSRYTIAVILISLTTFLVPYSLGHESFGGAFYRAMTVLVVASPCAVVISIPAAILAAIAGAARRGILFKGGACLESAARIRAIAIDKTGTLTLGSPRVVEIYAAPDRSTESVIRLAAAAEQSSEHPLSLAIMNAATTHGVVVPQSRETQAIVGSGIEAIVEGRLVRVGKPSMASQHRLNLPKELESAAEREAQRGHTVVYVADEQDVVGLIAITDELRPGAVESVAELKALGLDPIVMLTGDHERVAQAIAGKLRIDYQAELQPDDKLKVVLSLVQTRTAAGMVGDGINDAPALAAATLGVSLGGAGTDVALETADLVLIGSNLRLLPLAIHHARRAQRVIVQNLVIAFGAMLCLLYLTYFGSLRLPLAVVGHEGSTVLVILNGLRLLAIPEHVKPDSKSVVRDVSSVGTASGVMPQMNT